MRIHNRLITGAALLTGSLHLQAQQLGLEYDTELQTDFRGGYNWANLLRLDGSLSVTDNFSIGLATISVAKTAESRLLDDLQVYSNIEEDNLPLAIAVLGAEYTFGRSTLFAGIRNVNEDYFTSPVTSLFVNSSCGIFPTLSGNYDIANYPLSSWCVHYRAAWSNLVVQTSLYDGLGHRAIAGHDNVFELNLSRDGVFSITSAEYIGNGSSYSMGCAVYYGVHNSDEVFVEAEGATPAQAPQTAVKSWSVAPWLNLEHRLTDACSVMLQGSFSTAKTNCRSYFGGGAVYKLGDARLGLFADHARYTWCSETAVELTCHLPLSEILSVQPALEVIRTGSRTSAIGLIRLSISL